MRAGSKRDSAYRSGAALTEAEHRTAATGKPLSLPQQPYASFPLPLIGGIFDRSLSVMSATTNSKMTGSHVVKSEGDYGQNVVGAQIGRDVTHNVVNNYYSFNN